MDCKLRAKNCGGCPMLGMDYAAQLKQKEETVKKAAGQIRPGGAHPGHGNALPLSEQGDINLYHWLGWKTYFRHLRGKQP